MSLQGVTSPDPGPLQGVTPDPSPCLQPLMLSRPEPRQFPAGTQKPALSGFRVWLANTWLGGTKRYAGRPFTVTSST